MKPEHERAREIARKLEAFDAMLEAATAIVPELECMDKTGGLSVPGMNAFEALRAAIKLAEEASEKTEKPAQPGNTVEDTRRYTFA
jgi:hypothetical protein